MGLYGIKDSGEAFRSKLAGVLHELNYFPKEADPNMWLQDSTKLDDTNYYAISPCYMDHVLVIIQTPMHTIELLKITLQIKGEKANKLAM